MAVFCARDRGWFSVREVRMAIVADLGSLQRLVGIIGDGHHLRKLALTGQDIDATRAERIALVNDVHPDEAWTRAVAHEIARSMAANSPFAAQGIKDVLDAERAPRVEAGLRYVAAWTPHSCPPRTSAAFAAFEQRREPRFEGR